MKSKNTKIFFSNEELAAIQNEQFFFLKNNITQKIFLHFAELLESMKKSPVHQSFDFPPKVHHTNGKISKGENYLLLPYIMMDFPKYFGSDGIFAFRTMFWWGNFFSFTLHLSGDFFVKYRKNISANLHQLKHHKVYFCINESEWEHHFEKENYRLIGNLKVSEIKKLMAKKTFLKLSRKINLSEWNKLNKFGTETYELFLKILK